MAESQEIGAVGINLSKETAREPLTSRKHRIAAVYLLSGERTGPEALVVYMVAP